MESGHAGSHGAWETPVPAGGPNIGRKSMKPLYKEKYPHVFTPLTVGKKGQVTFKHRIMVPPIGSQGDIVDSHHRLNRDGVEFYMHWARGGAACNTVPMEIPANGGHRGDLVLDDEVDGFIYMHNLQRPAHMYGTKTLCEIYHAGCCMLPWPGYELISSSAFMYNGRMTKAMDKKDMDDVKKMYVDAAVLAMRSGFDGILLHYGHGWLMNNFLSPLCNKRTDEYGGSVENRCRYPLSKCVSTATTRRKAASPPTTARSRP